MQGKEPEAYSLILSRALQVEYSPFPPSSEDLLEIFLTVTVQRLVSGLTVVHLAGFNKTLLLIQRSVVPPLSLDNMLE